ncbi:MAG TPA: error-prone DNA polymerase [Acidimicrobiales bacterium]|nr:error-prone DNA polymerase [Acidimicrobiales bacterium]
MFDYLWSMPSFNPVIPWSELERRLAGRGGGANKADASALLAGVADLIRARSRPEGVPYVELHCHSNFSFLDGASDPETLVDEAVRLGLAGLALTDHNGMYGAVRFATAAREVGLPAIFGAELSLPVAPGSELGERAGAIDPQAHHLVVLAEGATGYATLSAAIGRAHLRGSKKGQPVFSLEELGSSHHGNWVVLTGCRHASVRWALEEGGPRFAARALDQLIACFGRDRVFMELFDHGSPLDSARNDALAEIAARARVAIIATANAHYATSRDYPLASVLSAVRSKKTLEEIAGWLPAWAGQTLRSSAEQERRFARYPGALETTVEIGESCAFDFSCVAPGLPPFPVPEGSNEGRYLRDLAYAGALVRYGMRDHERVLGAWRQIDRELEIINQLDFSGYFLVVYDIVEFCRQSNIYCQGRGSAANSAVCYALGITNVDAVGLGLLFERFLSAAREGPPDIDLDIESSRRDEVIAYVYERYDREHAAQVANVITYRTRSAIRDVGRALGYEESRVHQWSKEVASYGSRHLGQSESGQDPFKDVPAEVTRFVHELLGAPRHLGIHSGGMVICDRPVIEVCPVEWARREGRSVLQWDKDDCAEIGLVKFDLLGLGMLEALHRMIDLLAGFDGTQIDLALIEQDDAVYAMLTSGDSMGVFQVESRAQMATLPRLRPMCFYDLVVEVALIRPGPIQGGSVHPYLRRRAGKERVTYLHPLLERSLKKTLGVPLFQEQLMQIAIDVAGFSATEADQLRQAMGSKRSAQRMQKIQQRLYEGMFERGVSAEVAERIFEQLAAFANYGFPESHAVSFAYLVYASAWLKLHYPEVFLAGLLNAQPMGFWSPQSLVGDAMRHGVVVHRAHVNHSQQEASLVKDPAAAHLCAVRLGLGAIRGIGRDLARRIAEGRPYMSLDDLARRSRASAAQLETLGAAGACEGIGPFGREEPSPGAFQRRESIWSLGALATPGADRLPYTQSGAQPPSLSPMTAQELSIADLATTGITPDGHPLVHLRQMLRTRSVLLISALADVEIGRVMVAGVITHRQRPGTAGGMVFLNLEDESGLVNIVCSPGLWLRYRNELCCPAVIVRGRLERADMVVNVIAEWVEALDLGSIAIRSRNFH